METDKRVDTLESEFKLMKGEVKKTLSSVRDHLLNLKLPASQEATLLAAAMTGGGGGGGGGGGSEAMSMDGKFQVEKPDKGNRRTDEVIDDDPLQDEVIEPENEQLRDEPIPDEPISDEPSEHDPLEPEAELPQDEEEPMQSEATIDTAATVRDFRPSTPPVNLLANLLRWVANAKREIGGEQLATFLEVYGISGHLSPELKDVIMHLADISAPGPADDSTAEVWSQLVLELHGILTGADAPLHPLRPFWHDGDGEARREEPEKPKPKPAKLKLVLSGGDGKEREFSFDLKNEEDE